MSYFLVILAFLAGFLLIFGMNLLLADYSQERRRQIRDRLEEEFRMQQREKARGSMARKDLYELAAEGYLDLGAQPSLRERFRHLVEQSGVTVRPAQLFIWCLLIGGVPAAGVALATQSWIAALVCGLMGAAVPAVYVSIKRSRRQGKLLSQLPDAFELMSRVMRAGQTVSQALQSVADEFPRPIAEEFSYCWEQQNLGLSPEAAMRELSRRTGLLELKIFVVAMMVHRQTGGNFSELLDKLAKVIRERYRIRGHIQALTAEGRFQAYILLVLPFFLLGALAILNRSYVSVLFQYPAMLACMCVFEVLGALWMRKIINFDF